MSRHNKFKSFLSLVNVDGIVDVGLFTNAIFRSNTNVQSQNLTQLNPPHPKIAHKMLPKIAHKMLPKIAHKMLPIIAHNYTSKLHEWTRIYVPFQLRATPVPRRSNFVDLDVSDCDRNTENWVHFPRSRHTKAAAFENLKIFEHFFTYICCKNCNGFEKMKINEKEAEDVHLKNYLCPP